MRKKKSDSAKRKRSSNQRTRKTSLPRRIARATPLILVLVLLGVVFSRLGVLHKLETLTLDTEARLNSPVADSEVAIVNIVDGDYEKMFDSKSPLNSAGLRDLIDAIATGQPRVIGVDIDTSDKQFRDGFQIPPSWPPIVWERIVKELPESADEKPEPISVMGGRDAALDRDSGLALLVQDADDKVTRRYRRFIDTTEGPLPSFSWAVVHKFAPEKALLLDDWAEPLLIRYSSDREGSERLEFTAGKVIELAPQWKAAPQSSPLRSKIVLLGGSYLGQDRHDTPLGKMVGVRVLANVIETELGGGGYGPPGRSTIALLEIFDGVLLILLFHFFSSVRAVLISLVIVPLLALVCSLLSFGSVSRWAYFAPVLVGVLLFELYEHFRRHTVPQVYEEISGSATDAK